VADIETISRTLGTLITWLGQSSVSALSANEAQHLLSMLNAPEPSKRLTLKQARAASLKVLRAREKGIKRDRKQEAPLA
jgi:hypothetical protein